MTDDKRRETESMRRELEELRREVRQLRREVRQDDLTGLYNARALREQLEDFVDDCLVNGREPSLLFLDIDRFKETNEVHGHEAGGQILRQMGQLIARFVRAEDIAFRYGGDEFVVLLCGGAGASRVLGDRLRETIAKHSFRVKGLRGVTDVGVTVSVGVRPFRDGDTVEGILNDADRAMFEAKRRSRPRVVTP